jgi:hypothetical protein
MPSELLGNRKNDGSRGTINDPILIQDANPYRIHLGESISGVMIRILDPDDELKKMPAFHNSTVSFMLLFCLIFPPEMIRSSVLVMRKWRKSTLLRGLTLQIRCLAGWLRVP